MDNDPVNKSNEEEYQFIDSEHSSNLESMSPKSSPGSSLNQPASEGKKKIFLLIGAAVAIFCLYKLVDVFSATPAKPKTEAPAVVAAKPVVETKPAAVAQEPVVPPAPTEMTTLQDKVGTLERVVSKVSQTNANLQDQMAGVATSMADIQNNLSTLTQQISDMAKAKEKPAEETKKEGEANTEKTKAEKPKVAKSARSKKKTIAAVGRKENTVQASSTHSAYYVKAMIQGRAWLMTPDGASATVAMGDNLPGYGEVSNIDVTKGEVTTTSGKVIGYKADDK